MSNLFSLYVELFFPKNIFSLLRTLHFPPFFISYEISFLSLKLFFKYFLCFFLISSTQFCLIMILSHFLFIRLQKVFIS